jgi:hypothetical protein
VEEWEVKMKGVSILLYIFLLLAAVLWHLVSIRVLSTSLHTSLHIPSAGSNALAFGKH